MTKKSIGIREVAALAGVSVATVSRVINTPELTAEETRQRVNAVIQQHHYVPNLVARGLYTQNSNSFALFVYDLENPFFIALVKELHKIAFERKCTLLICDTESSPEKEKEYFHYCEGIRTRGIIFTEGFQHPDFLRNTEQALAFLDRDVGTGYASVRSDNRSGISMLMDYLYNLGHRIFGFAGYSPSACSCAGRMEAFSETLRVRGLPSPPENVFCGPMTPDTGVRSLDYFCTLRERPTAVVCANDQVARGLIVRANKLGLSIPGDFSVVGFDGCAPDYFYPSITTIRQDVPSLARELFACVSGEYLQNGPREHVVPVSLVIGDSCSKVQQSQTEAGGGFPAGAIFRP